MSFLMEVRSAYQRVFRGYLRDGDAYAFKSLSFLNSA